mmetsp:Transcript_36004/g.57615  ORF Transcript_36004/g.57615 Transcript_36004/m.57615 type:complete len:837 (-) Transcript_36004:1303-3813(-)|eukprot:CAMPEP_0203763002 /NCGR_PEP_ID=MMETSP0098-20131031/15742_1 /ASSEMBLY_ACC=CAM_ASM_000208 /TAXON_ID=96639 /ORGANISM=" , Strain NY0313808BC1" /LENGTH=836 /DNA_ID=CAMNT_0050657605 /DNA_START=679 /DNA_END=3189 /DNA_ORIENTATION=-
MNTVGLRSRNFSTGAGLPSHARAVVVGGGIIGNSVAYHLGKRGWKDVVLIERDQLTSGTTWHAAGLMVTFGSTSETSTELRKYTKELYKSLEEETGQSTGFKPCGFVELATNKDYLHEFRRTAAFNRKLGVDVQEISGKEVQDLFPLCRVDDVLAGFYVKDDGRVNPVDATMALAKGSKQLGVAYHEGVTMLGIEKENGRVTGIRTDKGDIKTDYVINCTGMWARQLAGLDGISSIPNQAAEHYYLVTEKMEGVDPDWPIIEDPSSYTYIRPESNGGLLVGLFETEAAAWNVENIPEHFSFGEIQPDWDRMSPFLETAMSRVPATLEAGAQSFFCGPESFTPDLSPVIGQVPELENYFVAAGLNSIGILTGGGIGKTVADWVVDGKPSVDVTGMNVTRFEPYQSTPQYRADRVAESLGMVYKPHFPNYQMKTARNVKLSPLHDRLVKRGAYFKPVSGWEGADWYDPESCGASPTIEQLSWGKESWFEHWEREHKACRENVALFDMSFMAKFLVQGQEAGEVLNYLSTANVNGDHDMITYTQWLNDDARVEADLTVAKIDDETYLVVATDTMNGQVESYLKRNMKGRHAFVTNVTGAYSQINIQGPNSRKLMQALTAEDMSNETFPFRTFREIDIGYAKVRCARITYVGELGYELYIPTEQAVHVYDTIVNTDSLLGLGMEHAGLKALNSLRLEKGYRDYGHDIDNMDFLAEVGLTFTCDMNKDFRGKNAIVEWKNSSKKLYNRMVQVLLEDPREMLFHAEILERDGAPVGTIRSGSFGHTLGGSVGLGMIDSTQGARITPKYIKEGKWTVDIGGAKIPANVSLRPLYDPTNNKIKA